MELGLARAGIRALFVKGLGSQNLIRRGRGLAVFPTGIPADPAVHSVSPDQDDNAEESAKAEAAEGDRVHKPEVSMHPLVPPKPPVSPSPKLENMLNQPIKPTTQQRRQVTSNATKSPSVDDVACIGIDGSPWPEEKQEKSMGKQRKEQEEDDVEYFKHHKASPLSEIEVEDTRKPISKATDGTADSYFGDNVNVILFSDEQKDSAEDSLRRASEIWWKNRVRGDPDSPHGRVLRELRGENW